MLWQDVGGDHNEFANKLQGAELVGVLSRLRTQVMDDPSQLAVVQEQWLDAVDKQQRGERGRTQVWAMSLAGRIVILAAHLCRGCAGWHGCCAASDSCCIDSCYTGRAVARRRKNLSTCSPWHRCSTPASGCGTKGRSCTRPASLVRAATAQSICSRNVAAAC